MRGFRKTLLAALAGLALAFGAGSASADSIDYLLTGSNGAILCGGGSQCVGPYADVNVNLTSSTTATITFTSLSNNGFLYLMGGAQAANVNVNATSFTVSSLGGTSPANITGGTLSSGGGNNADGFGKFNVNIDDTDGFNDAYKTITFILTDTQAGGSWASAGSVLTNNAAGFLAAAHIFPCTVTAAGCDLVNSPGANGSTGFAAVPIPAAAWLFGSGLVGLIAIARRRIKGSDSPALA